MGIGNIKNAITGFVKEAGQKAAATGAAVARAPVLDAQLQQVNLKLAGLKGWGPEVKAQRNQLEGERKVLQEAIRENAKQIPNTQNIMRNMKG